MVVGSSLKSWWWRDDKVNYKRRQGVTISQEEGRVKVGVEEEVRSGKMKLWDSKEGGGGLVSIID